MEKKETQGGVESAFERLKDSDTSLKVSEEDTQDMLSRERVLHEKEVRIARQQLISEQVKHLSDLERKLANRLEGNREALAEAPALVADVSASGLISNGSPIGEAVTPQRPHTGNSEFHATLDPTNVPIYTPRTAPPPRVMPPRPATLATDVPKTVPLVSPPLASGAGSTTNSTASAASLNATTTHASAPCTVPLSRAVPSLRNPVATVGASSMRSLPPATPRGRDGAQQEQVLGRCAGAVGTPPCQRPALYASVPTASAVATGATTPPIAAVRECSPLPGRPVSLSLASGPGSLRALSPAPRAGLGSSSPVFARPASPIGWRPPPPCAPGGGSLLVAQPSSGGSSGPILLAHNRPRLARAPSPHVR